MRPTSRRWTLCGLIFLLVGTACADSTCGGCIAPLEEPFPEQHRVYDGVQVRVTPTGWGFVEDNLVVIIESMLQDGLTFEIPPTDFSYLGVDGTICETPCPVQAQILDSILSLVPPDRIGFDGHVDVDATITLDAEFLGFPQHCEFPLALRNKPISAQVILQIDPVSHFFLFDITDIQVTIEENDYDIICPDWFDWLLEWLKGVITGILNAQLQSQLNGAVDGLLADQTCVGCDFYLSGCPAGSVCNGDGFCESGGACLVKPLGLVGVLELGEMLSSVDPTNDASVDMLVALGQAQQPSQRPFVRNQGLEVRVIGGTYSDKDECIPDPNPADIPPEGIAGEMLFDNIIPGSGDPYMIGVAIADMYLDYFFYQLWRSGMLCLSIDSYGVEQISSKTLALFIPSLDLLTDDSNAPVSLALHPVGVPTMEVGAGTFLPDGTMDEPILYLFLPDLGMDFWIQIQGRWVKFLSLTQDVEVRLGLEFTQDNQVIPLLDGDSVVVTNAVAADYELLAEDPEQLEELVPQLIGMFLPMLTDLMGGIEIPDLQGFVLDIKSVQGDVRRPGTDFYEFMSIYADLDFDFQPPAPGVDTRARLEWTGPDGFDLTVLEPDHEIQMRLDGGAWSTFRPGPRVHVRRPLLPGWHELEVRARVRDRYRTLDPVPQCFRFETREAPLTRRGSAPAAGAPLGCSSASGHQPAFVLMVLAGLFLLRRRNGG